MSSDELSSIDRELRKLKACALSEKFLNRLEDCAEGRDLVLSEKELKFESELRKSIPVRLAPAELAEFAALTDGTPFAVDEKIVLFPKPATAVPPARRSVWHAAAAVALIGAITAVLIPQQSAEPQQSVAVVPAAPQETSPRAPLSLSPASFNRNLAEAQDEGVVWHGPDRPHRVLRIVYMDKVIWRDAVGNLIEVEQPRVEYILVPEKID